jgi:hypothetical protein
MKEEHFFCFAFLCSPDYKDAHDFRTGWRFTMKIRGIITASVRSFLCLLLTWAAPLHTASAAEDVPLAIVRFNQSKVMFEQQLYRAVNAAVQTKATVEFDVVSFVPITTKDSDQDAMDNKAKTEAERVMAAFKAMKIDLSRLHFSTEHVANLRNHEVQVFVK